MTSASLFIQRSMTSRTTQAYLITAINKSWTISVQISAIYIPTFSFFIFFVLILKCWVKAWHHRSVGFWPHMLFSSALNCLCFAWLKMKFLNENYCSLSFVNSTLKISKLIWILSVKSVAGKYVLDWHIWEKPWKHWTERHWHAY